MHNKVYLYNSFLEYVQTAKSWSEAAKMSGAASYRIVHKYLDSGELFENNWYFFSKELSSERIAELKDTTDAELIPILLANESYQGQDITIYLYSCSNIQKHRSYQLVKVTENILEAANLLNTSCKIIERHLDSNKHFKRSNKYLVRSKPIRDEENDTNNINKPEPEPESESKSRLPLSTLPEADFLYSIRRFAANHYTNVYPIPEIFGQMDESALLTISILLQEYVNSQ